MPRSEGVPRGYKPDGGLPSGAADLLERYVELVRAWAPRLDLVAPGELARFGRRHIEDSLRALRLVDSLPDGPAIDVGSGAGLPGIPLAIAGRARRWRLLEPRHRRAGFLEEVVRELGLDWVEVAATTAEGEAASGRSYAVATARALAPPPDAFRILRPLVPAGVAVVWVGESSQLPREAALFTKGLATMPEMGDIRKNMDK